ncbi:MAG: hypothetical protein DSY59_04980 [Persephonella sp.]|nr:MAG: hypothetical protein DSY59_04980 [Persephonella sp.]
MYTNFSETIFNKGIIFNNITFNNYANFSKTILYEDVSFNNVIFITVDFKETIFNNKSTFIENIFDEKTNFNETIFKRKTFLINCKVINLQLENINFSEKSYFEIRNTSFIELVLSDFINHTNNFLISDVKILKKLEIKKCVLNNMKFTNCDFSEKICPSPFEKKSKIS